MPKKPHFPWAIPLPPCPYQTGEAHKKLCFGFSVPWWVRGFNMAFGTTCKEYILQVKDSFAKFLGVFSPWNSFKCVSDNLLCSGPGLTRTGLRPPRLPLHRWVFLLENLLDDRTHQQGVIWRLPSWVKAWLEIRVPASNNNRCNRGSNNTKILQNYTSTPRIQIITVRWNSICRRTLWMKSC